MEPPDRILSNGDLVELLWRAGDEETAHRRRALQRAARAARHWNEEARDLAEAGRSLTELRAVGPWVAARIHGWLDSPPEISEPDETRRGFLTLAEVRRVLDAEPAWERTPHADLQVHTTYIATAGFHWRRWSIVPASSVVPSSRSPTIRRASRSRTGWTRSDLRSRSSGSMS